MKYLLTLYIILFFISCSAIAPKKRVAYEKEPQVDTSDITTKSILNESDILNNFIMIDSPIDSKLAKKVILKLRYLDKKQDRIKIYLNTPGGWLSSAFKIVDTINSISTPVDIYVTELCESAGVVVLISATGKRVAYTYAEIAPHFNRNYSKDPKVIAINKRFEELYREKTKLPSSWYPLTGNRLPHFTAEEAKKLGLIDEVITP